MRRVLVIASVLALAAWTPAGAQVCLVDPWGDAKIESGPKRVHPRVAAERHARALATRDWSGLLGAYQADVDTAFNELLAATPSPEYRTLADTLRKVMNTMVLRLPVVVAAPVALRAQHIDSLIEFTRFRPTNALDGSGPEFLFSRTSATGVRIPVDSLSADEARAICWTTWGLYRFFALMNFETVPAAMARINAQATRWERYRTDGPMQLPHEMVVNRLLRFVRPPRGPARYNPPRFELVALHPMAAIELTQRGNKWDRSESLAAEIGGGTLWLRDWRQHIGVSWILAIDESGERAAGALARLGGYVTVGFVRRTDEETSRKKLNVVLTMDALRLLKPDVQAKLLEQFKGVAGTFASEVRAPR